MSCGHGGREPEATAGHHFGEAGREELARHEERPLLDHPLDRALVQAVAVVDDVDPGVERHVQRRTVGDVPAHECTALMRGLHPGRDLLGCHLRLLGRGHRAVAAGDEHLDDLRPLLDLLAHGAPELGRSVGAVDGTLGPDVPVPREALVAGVPGRADVAAACHEPRTGEEALGDGRLHGGIDGEGCARAHRAGEATAQEELEVMGGPHGLERRRLLEPEGRDLGTELVVRGVEVAAHHARHHGAPAQAQPPGPLRRTSTDEPGRDGGDATVLDDDSGVGTRAVGIHHGGADQRRGAPSAAYFQPVSTCSNHHCGAAATSTFMSQ